jgi:hypothetical protein
VSRSLLSRVQESRRRAVLRRTLQLRLEDEQGRIEARKQLKTSSLEDGGLLVHRRIEAGV